MAVGLIFGDSSMVQWLLVACAAVLLAAAMYWTCVTTEGSYLGAKMVAWLYDLYARRYDAVKAFDPHCEDTFLTRPLLLRLGGHASSLVLDVATGTGRIPLLLLGASDFSGRVVGLDFSRRMLELAAEKASGYSDRVVWVWQNASQLPFPDGCFHLVTCLEALEFMPRPKKVLEEMVRVAKPGADIVLTRRRGWEGRLMPGKNWSAPQFMLALKQLDLNGIQISPWQHDYDLVWARLPGNGSRLPAARDNRGWVEQVLNCPHCGVDGRRPSLMWAGCNWLCPDCQYRFPVSQKGIINLAAGRAMNRRSDK